MAIVIEEVSCYNSICDMNSVEDTCMFGKYMKCRLHCDNCQRKCKKTDGDRACNKFKRRKTNE